MTRAVHDARRQAAYTLAGRAVSARAPVRFTDIDATACTAFQKDWQNAPARKAKWNWHLLALKYQQQRYARLDLAIWSGATLCGLVLGKFSRAETVLQLNFIEGAPTPHPLQGQVLDLGVTIGLVLGTAYGSKEFRVTEPAPHVVKALLLQGFRNVARSKNPPYYQYCERQLP